MRNVFISYFEIQIEDKLGLDSSQKAKFIARLILDKKAQNILIMDMREIMDLTDFFIICSADSRRQVKTVADYILGSMKEKGLFIWHMEGYEEGSWVLLDYGDAIAHIFLEETRNFYSLEKLWRDAPVEKVS